MNILEEALEVTQNRQVSYDKPERNMNRIKDLWNAYLKNKGLDFELDARDVAVMNILQKIAREIWAHKRDNWVDIAGYAHVGFQTVENSEKETDEGKV